MKKLIWAVLCVLSMTMPVYASGLTTIDGCQGLSLRVASEHAHKFQSFFCDLKAHGHKAPRGSTACQAYGHMPGSKHDWGGACDVGQTDRNVAVRFMYHVSALIRKHGLVDGCRFHDCGHVEVPGSNRGARIAHYKKYPSRIKLARHY